MRKNRASLKRGKLPSEGDGLLDTKRYSNSYSGLPSSSCSDKGTFLLGATERTPSDGDSQSYVLDGGASYYGDGNSTFGDGASTIGDDTSKYDVASRSRV
mmetsp:Transcript_48998/g.135919  ORF Transcript_48998/g.135919 Transcript_48998/m.135919 type:complete len:100 (+) Transcript_48998:406-705(+)